MELHFQNRDNHWKARGRGGGVACRGSLVKDVAESPDPKPQSRWDSAELSSLGPRFWYWSRRFSSFLPRHSIDVVRAFSGKAFTFEFLEFKGLLFKSPLFFKMKKTIYIFKCIYNFSNSRSKAFWKPERVNVMQRSFYQFIQIRYMFIPGWKEAQTSL